MAQPVNLAEQSLEDVQAGNVQQERDQNWLKTQAMSAYYSKYGTTPEMQEAAANAQAAAAKVPYAGPQAAADVANKQAETAQTTQGSRNKDLFSMGEQLQAFADPKTGAIDPNKTMAVGAALGLDPQKTSQYAQMFAQPNQQPGAPGQPVRNQALDGTIHGAAGASFMAVQGSPTLGVDADGKPVMAFHDKMGDVSTQTPNFTPNQNQNTQNSTARVGLSAQRLGLMTQRYGLAKVKMAQDAVNQGLITGDQVDEYINSLGNAAPGAQGTPQPAGAPPAQGAVTPAQAQAFLAQHGGKIDAAIAASPNDAMTNALGDIGSAAARGSPVGTPQTPQTPGQVLANATDNKLHFKSQQEFASSLGQSGPSSAGGIIRSGGAVIAHLGLLKQYSEALSNGDVKAANYVAQEFRNQVGQAPPAQFDAQREVVTSELGRFLTARGATQAQIERMEKSVSTSSSPQQLRGVIDTWTGDIAGQFRALGQQAHSFGMDKQFDAQLTPEARTLVHGGATPQGSTPHGPLKVGDTLPGTSLTIVKVH